MSASIHKMLRAPVGALVLVGIMSSPALAAWRDDPAKTFIASLAGERDSGIRHDPVPTSALPQEDPARRFIDGLGGKHERPSGIGAPGVDKRPERDFIDRIAGRAP
ncbi:hypothetical protein [Nitrospirillum sp. BR 11163]|uniref:hypothetical protein n=1 Tax=Nitrospirillum sp. BR 11163 TaxID=3104323 RepID=UPI002AFDF413|nr:hypothetical protein [Nitrospirillum sp. BR 11163]MEA1673224.1 hypothetical protein [Nitrospirillum sp. BR 11163]